MAALCSTHLLLSVVSFCSCHHSKLALFFQTGTGILEALVGVRSGFVIRMDGGTRHKQCTSAHHQIV